MAREMSNRSEIEAVRETLLTQLEPLEQEYADLRERMDLIEQTKSVLEDALKTLDAAAKGKKPAKPRTSKPYARKQEVAAVCEQLVKANAPIAKADLEELVKHKLSKEQGFNLSGVSLRLKEVLAGETFEVQTDGAVVMAKDTTTAVTTA